MSGSKAILFLLLICLNYVSSNKFLSFLQASDSLKDAFANYFKVGTSVSPNELTYGRQDGFRYRAQTFYRTEFRRYYGSRFRRYNRARHAPSADS